MNAKDASIPWDDPMWLSDDDDDNDKNGGKTLSTEDKLKPTIENNSDQKNNESTYKMKDLEEDQDHYVQEFKKFTINNLGKDKHQDTANVGFQRSSSSKETRVVNKLNNNSLGEVPYLSEEYHDKKNINKYSKQKLTGKMSTKNRLNKSTNIKVLVKRDEVSLRNKEESKERIVYFTERGFEKHGSTQVSFFNTDIKSDSEHSSKKERKTNQIPGVEVGIVQKNILIKEQVPSKAFTSVNDRGKMDKGIAKEEYYINNKDNFQGDKIKKDIVERKQTVSEKENKFISEKEVEKCQMYKRNVIEERSRSVLQDNSVEFNYTFGNIGSNDDVFNKGYRQARNECGGRKSFNMCALNSSGDVRQNTGPLDHGSVNKRPAIQLYNPASVQGKWSGPINEDPRDFGDRGKSNLTRKSKSAMNADKQGYGFNERPQLQHQYQERSQNPYESRKPSNGGSKGFTKSENDRGLGNQSFSNDGQMNMHKNHPNHDRVFIGKNYQSNNKDQGKIHRDGGEQAFQSKAKNIPNLDGPERMYHSFIEPGRNRQDSGNNRDRVNQSFRRYNRSHQYGRDHEDTTYQGAKEGFRKEEEQHVHNDRDGGHR